MRFASFAVETPVGPARRVGVEHEGELLDLNAGYAHVLAMDGEAAPVDLAETIAPPAMIDFLRRGQRAFDAAEEVLERVPDAAAETGPGGARLRYERSEVDLLAPVPRPNSLRDYMVFEEHVANTLGDIPDVWYDRPVCYKSNADEVVGHEDVVEWPSYSNLWDIELEIGAVIGKRGTGIDADESEAYIAGYTLFNDFSARDEQGEEMDAQLGPARGKDFANALGPYLVTPDELDLPAASFSIEVTDEDGETEPWSAGTVGQMEHSWGEILAHTSAAETLYPGDVLGSGTIGTGCGLELGTFLDDGDTVSLSIDGLAR
jgi:2-keto-4-pentenoate hydratase/2-oxohepta-3-ene-1,7-dioic acid hydratase (catechol pathway)